MSEYQRVIDALQENDLSWTDVDQILLNPESYEDFMERASTEVTANHRTGEAPAVRETTGQEKIVYVADNGMSITIEL